MAQHWIEVDEELLAAAQRDLKTVSVSDTVHLALQLAAARSARARQVAWLRDGDLEQLSSAAQRAEVWR